MTLHRVMALALLAAPLGLACGDDYGSNLGGCTPGGSRVCLNASAFAPTGLTISPGTMVTWQDVSSLAHTVTSDVGSTETFDKPVAPLSTVSHLFSTSGTFGYHCEVHAGMTGNITVK